MNILAIDTVTQACSVALLTKSESYQQAKFEANKHSALVLGMVNKVLQEAALTLARVDLIAVNNGPGAFTGIRIGVGVAQGLAYGAGIPVLGINSLTVLAAQKKEDGSILSIIDARMGEVYWAYFSQGPLASSVKDVQLRLTTPEEVEIKKSESNLQLIASGCERYKKQFNPILLNSAYELEAYPMANELAYIAAQAESSTYQSAEQITPVYVRNDVASVSTKKRL